MANAPQPAFNVAQAMLQCGVPNTPTFDNQTPAERVSEQIFMDSFDTVLSISIDDVNDAMTAFSKLTATNGKISIQPGVKRKITAFVQWARTMIRTGQDPTLVAFPVANVIPLMDDLQTCRRFEKLSDTLASQAKPKDFTEGIEWTDWDPTFVNYLRQIPGRTGIPLSYIVRRTATPAIAPFFKFMQMLEVSRMTLGNSGADGGEI